MIERSGKLEFEYYFKGDFVRTPDGVGIVAVDEEKINTADDMIQSEVIVQHKFGLSSNPGNKPKAVPRECLQMISEREYNNEKGYNDEKEYDDEKKYNDEKIIEKAIFPAIIKSDLITAVKCVVCGDLHEMAGNTFISIHGNITIGLHGGVVGDNFDEFGNLKSVTYVCKHPTCFNELISGVFEEM